MVFSFLGGVKLVPYSRNRRSGNGRAEPASVEVAPEPSAKGRVVIALKAPRELAGGSKRSIGVVHSDERGPGSTCGDAFRQELSLDGLPASGAQPVAGVAPRGGEFRVVDQGPLNQIGDHSVHNMGREAASQAFAYLRLAP